MQNGHSLQKHTTQRRTVSLNTNTFDRVIAELRDQGLEVTLCTALDPAWYITDDGPSDSLIASGSELLALQRSDRLNIQGIKSLA
jgi:hypothetical protein